MPTFDRAYEHLLVLEGGVSNHEDDPGGLTKLGVTQATYDDWRSKHNLPTQSVVEITDNECRSLYRERYWDVQRLDLVATISPRVAVELFEAGVNCGVATAGRFLQEALNFLMPDNTRLFVDGVVGPNTRAALDRLVSDGHEDAVLRAQNGEQYAHYKALVSGRSRFRSFSRGWMRRIAFEGVSA